VLLLLPVAIAATVLLLGVTSVYNLPLTLGGHLACFFVIAMACHGELARTRPAARYLTGFYVALSFGGMVGGLFAGLIAPHVFSWVAEYPILLALAVLCRPLLPKPSSRWDVLFWLLLAMAAVALVLPKLLGGEILAWVEAKRNHVIIGATLIAFV